MSWLLNLHAAEQRRNPQVCTTCSELCLINDCERAEIKMAEVRLYFSLLSLFPSELLPEGSGAEAREQPGHQPHYTLHLVRLRGKRRALC